MRRLKKEFKLDVCNHIIVKYGSMNKDNPQVIYVSGKCWVSPQSEMDYESIISDIEKQMRKNIKLFFMDGINFDKKFILDFDVNTDKISVGDKKFLSFDFFVKQNNETTKQLKELKTIITGKVSTIVNNLVYLLKENNFIVAKTKRN